MNNSWTGIFIVEEIQMTDKHINMLKFINSQGNAN